MVGLSVAVVAFGASAWPAAGAGTDQIASTQAQLTILQQQVLHSADRIHDLTLRYEQAATQADALSQQVEAGRAEVLRIQSQVRATTAELRNDAILSYTGATANPAGSPAALGGSDDPSIREEYLQVAVGNLSDTLDRYQTQVGQAAVAAAALASEMKAGQAAVASASLARTQALAQAATTQGQLDAVQTRLQQLEAAQAAARASAQPARVVNGTPPRAATPSAQGLPVNGGLQTVVTTMVSPPPASGGNAGGVWLQLRLCESGNNYQENSGNGFYGAYQFSQPTWSNLGFPGRPDQEPAAMQDQAAQKLQAEAGWGQWPACSAALGLG